ncbi:MAG: hypothetical protein PGN30_10220 [Mycolicibacterium neoaurum]|uniref:hypothetical protein n=1 Tax=Mycolicibacterium neoaurum TaxID=1795 RepID=UPI002FF78E1E
MTSPSQPDRGLTYEQALALVAAAESAQTAAGVVQSVTASMSLAVAAARDTALQWASGLILGSWREVNVYDGSSVQAFTEQAGEYMVEAQSMVAQTAATAQVQILSTMGVDDVPDDIADPVDVRGTPVIDDGGTVTITHDTSTVDYTDGGRQVVDLDEDASTVGMFNRPARTQRYLESQGVGSEEARAQAEQRMLTLVDGNLMLAQRLAEAEILARAAGRDDRIIGTRRVIHPELSRSGTCGLCIAASDRLYSVRELLPMHTRCQCTTAAVTSEFDPADVLNAVDLSQLYSDAGDTTSGAALKRTRYKIDQHGELGPTLIPAKRTKSGAPDRRRSIVPTRNESPADVAARHLPQLEKNLAELRARGLSDGSSQVQYHQQQIARYRAVLSAK